MYYLCRFCDVPGFRWQYELYKHCAFKHFNEEMKAELPKEYPAKCPLCEYVSKTKTSLMIHYGITHKEVVKLIENALRNNPDGMPSSTSAAKTKLVSTTSSSLPALEQPFVCPVCNLSISTSQKDGHLCSHFKEELSKDLPDQVPFSWFSSC